MTNWLNASDAQVMQRVRSEKLPLESPDQARQFLQRREESTLTRGQEVDVLFEAQQNERDEKRDILRMAAQQSYDFDQTKRGLEASASELLDRTATLKERLARRELTTAEGAAEIATIRQELQAVNEQIESLTSQAVSMEAIVADPFAYADRLYRVYPALADRRKRLI